MPSEGTLAPVLDPVLDPVELPPVQPAPVTGPSGTLASALPVTSLAVGSVAHAARAATRLARARGLEADLTVDTRAVAAAFASLTHLRVAGRAPTLWAPLSGFFRAADGWVRLHGNYPHHAAALARALGTQDPGRLGEVVRARGAQEVEDAVVDAGGCAARVRTPQQWREHPQGATFAGGPFVAVSRRREIAPLPTTDGPPMAGLRVLDLTRVIAGPVATRLLAALGADVLRIDPPQLPELVDQHIDTGFGKRSAVADLAAPDVRARLETLLRSADVVVTGYRPGALAAHGLDATALAARHPHLVTVEVSAWGTEGPWAGRRGFDSIVQAASGIAHACRSSGSADEKPGALPVQALDYAVGHLAAAAAMTLLAGSESLGVGTARLSLTAAAQWLLTQEPGRLDRPDPAAEAAPVLHRMDSCYGVLSYAPPPLLQDGRSIDYPGPPAEYGSATLSWAR